LAASIEILRRKCWRPARARSRWFPTSSPAAILLHECADFLV